MAAYRRGSIFAVRRSPARSAFGVRRSPARSAFGVLPYLLLGLTVARGLQAGCTDHAVAPAGSSAPSPKSLGLRRRSVGCFSRRERSAAIWIIAVDPPRRRKNSQPAAAHRVALKMVACFVVRQSRIDPDMLLPPASQATHFERNGAQGI